MPSELISIVTFALGLTLLLTRYFNMGICASWLSLGLYTVCYSVVTFSGVKIRVQRARLWSTPEGWLGWLPLPAVFRCQVSGVRCQQPKSSRWIAVAYNMDLPFTGVGLQVQHTQCPGFRIGFLLTPDTWHLKPWTDLTYGRADHLWPGPQDQDFALN